jgi:hypothetical protein
MKETKASGSRNFGGSWSSACTNVGPGGGRFSCMELRLHASITNQVSQVCYFAADMLLLHLESLEVQNADTHSRKAMNENK